MPLALGFPAALLTSMLSVQTSHAEDAALRGLTNGLMACAKLGDSTERLSCYDQMVKQLNADRIHPPPPVTAPEMFGARPPKAEKPPDDTARVELTSIVAHITALSGDERSGAVVVLDNGQQWQQIGHEDLLLQVGERVKISRGAFNSFWLMTEGNRSAHFKRIR